MAKQKKKRNKSYTGQNARISKPQVTRISAVNRSPLKQWWHEKKAVVKPMIFTTIVVIVLILVVLEIIKIVS